MTCEIIGEYPASGSMDAEGHREYRVKFLIKCSVTDGPANVMQTPGLPVYGQIYQLYDDIDVWAWCRWDATVSPVINNEVCDHYTIELKFSTKQGGGAGNENKPPNAKACKDIRVEDPLLEPQKISGSFVKYTEEATFDRFGRPVVNSAWEQIRGPQAEFDASRQSIKIEQNVPDLQLALVTSMRDCVNDAPLWGMPRRCVKFTNFNWDRKFYGGCNVYFTRTFEFELRYDSFDKILLDEGTKALSGHWPHPPEVTLNNLWTLDNINGETPNPFNPSHFKRYRDKDGELTKCILDGLGKPYNPFATKGSAAFATVANGGSGYSVGSILQIVGGVVTVGMEAGQFEVTNVDENGTITGLVAHNPLTNSYTTPPENPVLTTLSSPGPGPVLLSGSGAGLYVTWFMTDTNKPGRIKIEKYNEANFLRLNIPTDLSVTGP